MGVWCGGITERVGAARKRGRTFLVTGLGRVLILDRHYIPHLHLPMHAYTGAFQIGRIGLGCSYNGVLQTEKKGGENTDGSQYGILNIASSLEGLPQLLEA